MVMKQEAAEVAKKGLDTDPKFAQYGVDLTFCSVVDKGRAGRRRHERAAHRGPAPHTALP